ncbi:alpha/beta fold hydrolase [Leptospira kanakyensis]|uniref:Alpha/beta fold hydrolase n=1 Tax=Leptospira kanakyensis TaxID=2484968 RepID=A0A6N4PYU1_9LEPT|nr:alpha/beta fold hydrolase [Leptospira kanakyensis]TGK50524.1 alpha/beta fold hydrolase [Leptospira kanakyensis]TGK63875.1 alpha/beta fold hydrolase [Leptospira kanakyensis]TGK69662.1 alpha/beta fold hydrolase [Leptospira kanakyensis]
MTLTLILIILLITFFLNQVYRFSHFTDKIGNTKKPEDFSILDLLKVFLIGIRIPKPVDHIRINNNYTSHFLEFRNIKLNYWLSKNTKSPTIVILFHGYAVSKTQLFDESEFFISNGYSTVLVDFRGSGQSSESYTGMGTYESKDVFQIFNLFKHKYKNKKIILFGHSLGSVAILRAIYKYKIDPAAIILQAPFDSFLNTTRNRFRILKIPYFPFAEFLVLFGSVTLFTNLLAFNPYKYAKELNIPVLYLIGEKDNRVFLEDIQRIVYNTKSYKSLAIISKASHDYLYASNKQDWKKYIMEFLTNLNKLHSI